MLKRILGGGVTLAELGGYREVEEAHYLRTLWFKRKVERPHRQADISPVALMNANTGEVWLMGEDDPYSVYQENENGRLDLVENLE